MSGVAMDRPAADLRKAQIRVSQELPPALLVAAQETGKSDPTDAEIVRVLRRKAAGGEVRAASELREWAEREERDAVHPEACLGWRRSERGAVVRAVALAGPTRGSDPQVRSRSRPRRRARLTPRIRPALRLPDFRVRQAARGELALARVKALPYRDPELLGAVAKGHGRPNGAGGAVEDGQEAVAHRLDLAATEASELPRTSASWRARSSCQCRSPNSAAFSVEPTMSVKSTVASTQSGAGGVPIRSRKRFVCSRRTSLAAEGRPAEDVAEPRDLDDLGPRDRAGDVAGLVALGGAVPDERRSAHGCQHVADVALHLHPQEGGRRAGAGAAPHVADEPLLERRVGRNGGAVAPEALDQVRARSPQRRSASRSISRRLR